jgi:hypothetical protein
VGTTHSNFMQQKEITLAAAAGYFETWSEACSARYGKVAGSKEVTGCISQETLHSIKITCENAPQIMLRANLANGVTTAVTVARTGEHSFSGGAVASARAVYLQGIARQLQAQAGNMLVRR